MRIKSLAIPAVAVTWCVLGLSAQPAGATGYWNMPCSLCQCMGCGMGAGYHACFVLGPINCGSICDHREVRLPHAPSPPCYGYPACNFNFAQSAPNVHYQTQPQYQSQPQAEPEHPMHIEPTPADLPLPAAGSAIFNPPVEQ